MKYIYIHHYLSIFILIFIVYGCSDWLNVHPSERTTSDELFKDGEGFRNALNGIYQEASSATLYGRELTWGLSSAMAQDYMNNGILTTYRYAAEYDFESYAQTKTITSNIWSKSYNLIANCNQLLNKLAVTDTSLFEFERMEKDLIMGEALALRAFFHLDLLRLYGPNPKQSKNVISIPYVKEYPNYYTPPKPMEEVLDNIITDLQTAADLVAYNDTITHRTQIRYGIGARFDGSYTAKNVFFNYRGTRLNYVAIHGLLARAYLYAGNTAKAFEEAQYVYNKYGPHSKDKYWTFTSESNSKGQNKYIKLADDIMFAFYDFDIMTKIQQFFLTNRWALSSDINIWFDKSKRDFRIGLINDSNQSEKWIQTVSTSQYRQSQNYIVPIIRMSEIYYIYSECLFKQGKFTEALNILNQIRFARGRTDSFNSSDENEFYNELIMEYRREFITEGQTFFVHKRLNKDIVTTNKTYKIDENSILPIPENETIF